jgi:predicted short-subunit dehydrogenase-like oxidoreductase (DUF2520 family)
MKCPTAEPVSRPRELDLEPSHPTPPNPRIAVVGSGRLGRALADALTAADYTVSGPHGRGYDGARTDIVLLCVPDAEIATAAAAITPGPLVGHCSGATGLEPLSPHPAFSLHPLMTVTAAGAVFAGAAAAIDGSSPTTIAAATEIAEGLGLVPIQIRAEDRTLYHAAACVASNFLVTLEVTAERLASAAGLRREHLVPLVKATVDNWATQGASSLTGPVARRDDVTVERQRAAIKERAGQALPLFDCMVEATRAL